MAGSFNSKYTDQESGMRGTTIVQQYPRDNSDDAMSVDESRHGQPMSGGVDDISPMIKGNKVPRE